MATSFSGSDDRVGNRRQGLIVVGMHRSGTSALTRVLSLLGAALPKNLMQAQPGNNETGFWEPLRIVTVHDEILQSIDSRWDDVLPVSAAWFASAAARSSRDRLVGMMREEFEDAPLFVLKDPRVCRLLPLWTAVLEDLGVEPLFVHMVRNPLEVAQSLRARDGFPQVKSLLLWLGHILVAEHATRGRRRAFVRYEDLLGNPLGTTERLGRDLGLTWPRETYLAKAQIEEFLLPRHRHHVIQDETVLSNRGASAWVRAVYGLLSSTANDQVLEEGFDALRCKYLEGSEEYGKLVAILEREKHQERGRRRGFEEQVVALQAGGAALAAENASLVAARAGLEAENASLAAARAGLEAENASLVAIRAGLEAENASLVAARAGLEAEKTSLAAARTALEREYASLLAARTALAAENASLAADNRSLSAEKSFCAARNANFLMELDRRDSRIQRLQSLVHQAPRLVIWLRALRSAPLVFRSGLFDARHYRAAYPDVHATPIPALFHFLCFGAREGRDPHPLFKTSWYEQTNPDVADAGVNPLVHYLRQGAAEGRDPHPDFSTRFYLDRYPDARASGLNPLVHYLRYGRRDGRQTRPATVSTGP